MSEPKIMLITGTRTGIGRNLAEYYVELGFLVIGCSRGDSDFKHSRYEHYCLDVCDEDAVKQMFASVRKKHKRVDILINNAGIASMNHFMLTPMKTVNRIFSTNVFATFLMCREAAKMMPANQDCRIVNFATVATALKLEGESVYAASKAAVESLTEVIARELGGVGITVNAVGPTPVMTDLIRSVPQDKLKRLVERQAIHRFGTFEDIRNVIDFYIKPESSFITGQVIYLGGV